MEFFPRGDGRGKRMSCTKEQIQLVMKYSKVKTLEAAAAKAAMSLRTARKYVKLKGMKEIMKESTKEKMRRNPFEKHWSEIVIMLGNDSGLEAKTIMEWLLENYPEEYKEGQLRTLQRRIRDWRALSGPDKEVYFRQELLPGRQSQSDYTNCNELEITIRGNKFPHLLFHFMLPYSRWETFSIAFSESFASLSSGYTKAVRELGGCIKEHRTDNLTAAVHTEGDRATFTKRWEGFLDHYDVEPSRNNAGMSNENGSVEKSHDLLKKAIDQKLRLRGSRDFTSQAAYENFVTEIVTKRNKHRRQRLAEEIEMLKNLPQQDWSDPKEFWPHVTAWSTITVDKVVYSVPSRMIGVTVKALAYPDKVEVYYGNNLVQEMPRLKPGQGKINYRHVIGSLVRKPGAFAGYKYREDLFPSLTFRKAYDHLKEVGQYADREYVQILHYAATQSESEVEIALELLLESKEIPLAVAVKELIVKRNESPEVKIEPPRILEYDNLLNFPEALKGGTTVA
jgi:hypothetical protein